ncbi:MAG: hypothetical protein R3F47_18905 [Gammaproteobacteria bacterium]|jgi:hypothetical protein
MSTSPKFRITIQGFAVGAREERVRLALGKRFGLTPQQTEQLLQNQAGPLAGLLEHQVAFEVRNELQAMGLECRIAPAPRANIQGLADKVTLQASDSARRLGQAAPVQRAPHRAQSMRAGKVRVEPRAARSSFSFSPGWRVAIIVALALFAGFSLQGAREPGHDTVAAADSVH